MSGLIVEHWQAVYRDKAEAQMSWSRAHLETSLRLIEGLHLSPATPVIDVGAGRSTLADDLLERGLSDITLLDIAEAALAASRQRLPAAAGHVRWLLDDVTRAALPATHYGLWHDRAVFHFLADETRRYYVRQAERAVRPGGYAIVATFAADGPQRCSGLPVQRYDAATLAAQFAPAFECVGSARDEHTTPWGSVQPFTYVVLRRQQTSP